MEQRGNCLAINEYFGGEYFIGALTLSKLKRHRIPLLFLKSIDNSSQDEIVPVFGCLQIEKKKTTIKSENLNSMYRTWYCSFMSLIKQISTFTL